MRNQIREYESHRDARCEIRKSGEGRQVIQISNRAKSTKRNDENRHNHSLRIVWIFCQHLVERGSLIDVLHRHFVDIRSDENEICAAKAELCHNDKQIYDF